MIIFLVGFMGCGKSTIGKQLAHKLNYKFIDIDILFTEITSCTIPYFFEQYGEPSFRNKESEILKNIDYTGNLVISTGGGTICYNNNLDFLKSKGIIIYLKLDTEILVKRLIKSHTVRPMLANKNKEDLNEWIVKLMQTRKKYYESANIIIDARSITVTLLKTVLQPYFDKNTL